jgi:probable F420-dependent oxidoreductase
VRPFRFGYQVRDTSAEQLRDDARRAEAAGFDVLHTYDHVDTGWPPLLPLLAAAEATATLRVCPLVVNNDFHHPVHLAREVAALDHLTGGRVELALGAGHSFTEYAAIGVPFDPPAVRKARLAESVEVVRRLLDGEEVTYDGAHHHLQAVRTMRARQDHLPIMVAVNGRDALAHAARHADIVGLAMLGRTLPDGHRHEVRWEADRLDRTVAHIRASAPERPPELNALVQVVQVTADRRAAAEALVGEVPGLTVDDALATPFLALGTSDEIAEHLVQARDRWGISYFSVRAIDDFAPVIERLRAVDRRMAR